MAPGPMSLFFFVFAANDHRVDFLSDGLGADSACSRRDEDQGPVLQRLIAKSLIPPCSDPPLCSDQSFHVIKGRLCCLCSFQLPFKDPRCPLFPTESCACTTTPAALRYVDTEEKTQLLSLTDFFPTFHLATKKISNHSVVPLIQLMLLSPFGLCSLTTKLKLLEDFSL